MLIDRWKGKLSALMLALLACSAAWSQPIRPFTANYQVRFHGLNGGILHLTFRKNNGADEYIYESTADPSLLAGFVISDAAREASTVLLDGNAIRPVRFFSDDGKKGDEKDSNLQFDWEQKRMKGRSERVDFDQALPDRMQDHLSIQLAVMVALKTDSELGDYSIIDAGEIKKYTYTKEGPATIKYKNQPLETIVVKSERTNTTGGRINRYWHAPSLDFLPVRAERSRNGKIDLTMELLDVKFAE